MVLLLTYLDPRDSLEMRLRRAFQNGFFYYSLNRREVIATQQVRDGGSSRSRRSVPVLAFF